MTHHPRNHPDRIALADEVHARPSEPVVTPARASYVAVQVDDEERDREQAHLAALCERHGVMPPGTRSTHFRADLGTVRLKWERHGEFSGYLLVAAGASPRPFAEPASLQVDADWLGAIPGRTVAAVDVEFLPGADEPAAADLPPLFGGSAPAGSRISDGAASIYTDFRLHNGGTSRWLVYDHGLTRWQAGRTLQRATEVEAYRTLALLALPIARRQTPRVLQIERDLAVLMDGIAAGNGDDEPLLQQLTRLAAEIESGLAASQFRFGACRAYGDLVMRRIAEMRESRLTGVQTIEEFMTRRFTPAVATVATASQRLYGLSERVARASGLLSTRVSIARERQNQSLLASMNHRARLQLRLQQTVEGLSVAAIVYYAAGLVGYLTKGAKAGGLALEPDLVVALAVPALAVGALLMVRRARRHAQEDDAQETATS